MNVSSFILSRNASGPLSQESGPLVHRFGKMIISLCQVVMLSRESEPSLLELLIFDKLFSRSLNTEIWSCVLTAVDEVWSLAAIFGGAGGYLSMTPLSSSWLNTPSPLVSYVLNASSLVSMVVPVLLFISPARLFSSDWEMSPLPSVSTFLKKSFGSGRWDLGCTDVIG